MDKQFVSQKVANVMLITEVNKTMFEEMLMGELASHEVRAQNFPLEVDQHYF